MKTRERKNEKRKDFDESQILFNRAASIPL